ncbi:hypothetical protein N7495_002928 [Penicillium taxi]|uniref:uncharacterized protein n=1 Tax=Penicillium taxi TaxID=168475 RepID=UPI00254513ED|nr:uncharacterized protein N7495_002928 [Penicillium taxi]KAJ5902400.1 hypothetical protein N7495_002928 [Penicillium taxi]
MLRQAVRGTRWYSVVRNQSISQRAFSAVAVRQLKYGGPNDKVTFFEQDSLESKTRREFNPEAEDVEEREEIEQELSKIQQELKVLEKGPFDPNSPFIQSLPEDDRKIALEALRKYDEERETVEPQLTLDDVFDEEMDDMMREEFEGLAMEQENWQDGANRRRKLAARRSKEANIQNPESHPYAIRFKKSLRQFAENTTDERARQEVWKSYRRCKQANPTFLGALPLEAVDLLWESQATSQSGRATRLNHLRSLTEDAASAGISLATPKILLYIEALHEGGATSSALEQWESYQAKLSRKKEDLEEYWMLGVRLFATDNNPQRAQDIALAFLANDKSRQARVLIPVIKAWARLPGKEAEVKAWALYLQLKTLLSSSMTMEDYDEISIGLLTAGRLETAVAIFKDMMVTGHDPANDSTALYKAALGLAGNLHASSIDEKAVNKVSLSVLTMLPRKFQNRFFYASWMKKLIGMGDVDSAALGVQPDSKHMNGVVAGWLRDGSAIARDKAERLAWSMIQHRIDTVWKRFQPTEPSPKLQVEHAEIDPSRIPFFLKRDVPPATIETFSILLLHYTRRGDDDMIKYLVKCLNDAHIQPNSYLMNHLLYADLRKQDIRSLWTKFERMSRTVSPDLETYACLWDCAKVQYDRGRTAFDAGFPSARQLFASMMQWYSQLSPRGQRAARDQFSKDLYDQVVRCFCLSKDVSGTLVVLHSMQATFSFTPDDNTARLIVLQVARLAGVPVDTPKHRLRRLSSTPRSKENISQVNRLVDVLSERKSMTLQAQGVNPDQLDLDEKQQYQLEIMASLLRIVLSRSDGLDTVQVEQKLSRTAAEMKADEIYLGSPLGVEDSQLL